MKRGTISWVIIHLWEHFRSYIVSIRSFHERIIEIKTFSLVSVIHVLHARISDKLYVAVSSISQWEQGFLPTTQWNTRKYNHTLILKKYSSDKHRTPHNVIPWAVMKKNYKNGYGNVTLIILLDFISKHYSTSLIQSKMYFGKLMNSIQSRAK